MCVVIDKFEANCTFLLMLLCRCVDGIDLNLGRGEVPNKQRAFVGDNAGCRIVDDERDSVGIKGDHCMSPKIMICCGKCHAFIVTTAMLLLGGSQ